MEVMDLILGLSESLGAPMVCVGIVAYMLKREQDLHASESQRYATIFERNTKALSDMADAFRELLTGLGGGHYE